MSRRRHGQDPADASAASDHVLLEQKATLGGHQLTLSVTSGDADSPDTVDVHVSYGSGQAEVTIRADEQERSSGARGPAPADGETLASAVGERPEDDSCFSDQAEAPLKVSTPGPDVERLRKSPNVKKFESDGTASRSELRIGMFDLPYVLDDKALERMLLAMPALRCLSVDWRLDRRKLDIDIVSQHCRNLVEVDLTRFRLDVRSLEQLCIACPELKVVKLPRKCDDSCVEVLLRNIPRLRPLDLASTNVTGQFLRNAHESLEKISLACCRRFGLVHHPDGKMPQTACWEKMRELDLSSASVTPADLTEVLRHFPQLERLSLAHCGQIDSASLLQTAELGEHLRDLDVSHVGSLKASDLLAVLTRCPRLERLSIAGCITQFDTKDLTACLTQLSRCTELRELDVSSPRTVSKPRLPHNYLLRIRGTAPVTECSVLIEPIVLTALLLGCQKMERLVLAGCYISESTSLRQLAQCRKLRELVLLGVATVNVTDLALGLSGCPLLERLSVVGLNAPLEQIVPPAGLPNLTYLNASESGLTNNSLRRLPGLFPKLHTLNVYGCISVNENGLMSYLPRLQQLRSLDLRRTSGVTDALLEQLKESHLKTLRLSCPERNDDITTEGLLGLALGCPSLKFLGLEDTVFEALDSTTIKNMMDTIRQQLSLHRVFVLCTNALSVQHLVGNSKVIYAVDGTDTKQPTHQLPGPVYVINTAAVIWDRD